MKNLGEASLCLDLEIRGDPSAKTMHLSQSAYVHDVLLRFDMSRSLSVPTPMISKYPFFLFHQSAPPPNPLRGVGRIW